MGFVSALSLASHLSWPIFGLTQGLGGACVSARMDSSTKDLERIGRVYYGLASPPSLAPLEFFWLVFRGSTKFIVGTSCCGMTQASGYHCAWPRWAVSVNGSLNLLAPASLFLQHSRHGPASWPLHELFPLPRMVFMEVSFVSCCILSPSKQCPAHNKSSKYIWCMSEYLCMSEY